MLSGWAMCNQLLTGLSPLRLSLLPKDFLRKFKPLNKARISVIILQGIC